MKTILLILLLIVTAPRIWGQVVYFQKDTLSGNYDTLSQALLYTPWLDIKKDTVYYRGGYNVYFIPQYSRPQEARRAVK